ncbi:MAG: hypothetical protein ACXADW_22985 [Candidatus Hodarchaeales archaeon]
MKTADKVATFCFVIFLVGVFIYSALLMPHFNLDILVYKNNNLHFCYPQVCHAFPILSNLFYKVTPSLFVIMLSPFASVSVFLLLYFLVSKKIIYWFPLLVMLPSYYYTLIPSVVDWLFLPILYDRLKKGFSSQTITIGTIMVFFHGPYAFFYVATLLLYLGKKRELLWTVLLSIPQLIPIMYFSQGYIWFEASIRWLLPVFDIFFFAMNAVLFRVLIMVIYMIVFLNLIRIEVEIEKKSLYLDQ